jgi:hypothetical protein
LSSAETPSALNLAKNIIIAGLAIQLAFFGLFLVVTTLFHYRIVHEPTSSSLSVGVPWRRFIIVLYAASAFILVRSIFRLAEYSAGETSALQTREVYFYIFDSTLMFITAVIFNVAHPSQIISRSKGDDIGLAETSNDGYGRMA